MKKSLLWVLACFALVTSCSKDETKDSTEVNPDVDIASHIVGEWISETHTTQSNKGIHSWEIINFSSANQATINGNYEEYTNGELVVEKTDDNVNVNYEIEGNNLKLTSPLGTINRSLTVSSINELSLQVTEESGTAVSYYRIINKGLVVDKESLLPDYKTMLPVGSLIKGYNSSNENVVNVDTEGFLYAIASGSAYVYVETDKGTAAIPVYVKRLMETDYAVLLGKTKADVLTAMGNTYIDSEDGVISYRYEMPKTYNNYYYQNTGNWGTREVWLNENDIVTNIEFRTLRNTWFTISEITDSLTQKYTAYDKASSDTKKVFLNATTLKEATVRIIWDTEQQILTFTQNNNDIVIGQEIFLPDYTGLLGELDILNYRSENEYIATVDENGTITGIDSGNTNIVVVTNQGTFKLPIQVHIFLAKDYEALLGGKRTDINNLYNVVPNSYYDDDDYDLILKFDYISFPQQQRETGNWESIKFKMNNPYLGPITEVLLTARPDVWFTDVQMIAFLKAKYTYDENNSTETSYFFVNNKEEDLVSISIIWNTTDRTLKYSYFKYF